MALIPVPIAVARENFVGSLIDPVYRGHLMLRVGRLGWNISSVVAPVSFSQPAGSTAKGLVQVADLLKCLVVKQFATERGQARAAIKTSLLVTSARSDVSAVPAG